MKKRAFVPRLRRAGKLLGLGLLSLACCVSVPARAQQKTIVFEIGRPDGDYAEFAIAGDYAAFLQRFPHDVDFVVGRSRPEKDWPFVHPGPLDTWAGGRSHAFRITFALPKPVAGYYRFVADFVSTQDSAPPLLVLDINGTRVERRLPPGASDAALTNARAGKRSSLEQIIPAALLREGVNSITLINAEGSWALYDDVRLESGAPAPAEPLRVDGHGLPFFKRAPEGMRRALRIWVDNLAGGATPAEIVWKEGKDSGRTEFECRFGRTELVLTVPDSGQKVAVELAVRAAGREARSTAVLEPARKWRIYIVPTVHTDIGYTDLQDRVMARHAENTLKALAMAGQDPGFAWDFETFFQLDCFLKAHPDKAAEVEARLRQGRMGLMALFANMLTGLCSHEALNRVTLDARNLADKAGFTLQSAILDDVPSAVGSLPMVLAHSGIKYFIEGANNDRGPYATEGLTGPFYWEGPDGSRVLAQIVRGYAIAGGLITSMEQAAEALPRFLAAHDTVDYPFDAVLVNGAFSDNQGVASWLPEVAGKWNAEWDYPRLILGRPEDFFGYIEKHDGGRIPVLKTDFGGWWEDGAASSALETTLCRRAEDRAVTAEMLHSLAAVLSGGTYPKPELDSLWRDIHLYDEHTWGAWCSISEPGSEQTVKQWEVKSSFARGADEISRRLLAEGLAKLAALAPAADIVVFNPLAWTRKDIVVTETAGAVKDFATGKTLPSQSLPEGGACFIAPDLPSVGYRTYGAAGSAGPEGPGAARIAGNEMENEFYRVVIDPHTGALKSVYDKEAGRELVDAGSGFGLGELVYVSGGEGTSAVHSDLQTLPPPRFVDHRQTSAGLESRNGPVFAELASQARADMFPKITLRVRLYQGLKRLDLRYELDKQETAAKEAVYLAFPFALDVAKGGLWLEYPDAVTEPLKDQHPSACRDWYSVQRWLAASDGGETVVLSPLDTPLVTLGGMTGSTWPRRLSLGRAHVFAYIMNNFWHTNYKASQGGRFVLRFSITSAPGAFSKRDAVIRGWEMFSPPVAGPGRSGPQRVSPESARTLVAVQPAGLPLLAFKRAEDGTGFVFRLWDLSGAGGQAVLSLPRPAEAASLCDLVETAGRGLPAGRTIAAPIGPFGPLTLKVRFAP